MVDERLDGEVGVLEDDAGVERMVGEAEVDVEAALGVAEELEDGRERGLAGGEDVDGLAGHAVRVAPVQLAERPEEVREAADVVDVGMRDEDGADGGEVEARGVRLPGAVLARVEDIERLVDLQHQRRVVTAWLRLRAGAAP